MARIMQLESIIGSYNENIQLPNLVLSMHISVSSEALSRKRLKQKDYGQASEGNAVTFSSVFLPTKFQYAPIFAYTQLCPY